MIAVTLLAKIIDGERIESMYVLTFTSLTSALYFFFNKARTITASIPFNADTLSANLQLIGIVGASLPSNLIFFPSSLASSGKSLAIRGLFRIPSSKTDLV